MEYYAAVKRNVSDLYTLTWSGFQEILLSDKSTMQNNIYSMLPFVQNKREIKKNIQICLSLPIKMDKLEIIKSVT